MKKILIALLVMLLVFSMCGCSTAISLLFSSSPEESSETVSEPVKSPVKKPKDPAKEEEQSEAHEEQSDTDEESSAVSEEQSDAVEEPSDTKDESSAENPVSDPSLVSLRQAMIGTSETFAVAYFGFVEEYSGDLALVLRERCPSLTEDLPFLTQIPEGNVIGEYGEMYCIVPADENATVAVNLLSQDEEGNLFPDKVLYRKEVGEPIVLLCNYGGFLPDCVVYITDSEGKSTEFYPQRNSYGVCDIPLNENEELAGFDFSDYEAVEGPYFFWKSEGWLPPLKAGLDNTSWTLYAYRDDGVEATLMLDLLEDGTASFLWLLDGERREFTGDWYVEDYGDTALLTLDLFDGKEYFYEQFPVLIDLSGTVTAFFDGLEGTYLPVGEGYRNPMTFVYSVG